MLRHTVCNIEFGATDLERSASFYRGVLGWTVTQGPPDTLLFRSADGLAGTIRRSETVVPGRLPLVRVDVDEFAPLLELAARHDGGYTGFVDPVQGEWTVNLCDPDGNLIRLARSSGSVIRSARHAGDIAEIDGETPRFMETEPPRSSASAARRRPSSSDGGRAAAADYEHGTNGSGKESNRASRT